MRVDGSSSGLDHLLMRPVAGGHCSAQGNWDVRIVMAPLPERSTTKLLLEAAVSHLVRLATYTQIG